MNKIEDYKVNIPGDKLKKKDFQKTFSRQEVMKACLEYFKGDTLASEAWIKKYAVKNHEGEICELTPEDMHWRMAKEFARVEEKYRVNLNGKLTLLSEYGQKRSFLDADKLYDYFKRFEYIIPQGSVMSVIGNPYIIGSLSNCIVVPPIYDSYGGICYTDQQLAQLMKRRCGVGTDLSSLRPVEAVVHNAAGTSTGAVSFMERFSNTTREVAQSGRRGALMLSIDVRHPDIEEFVKIKRDTKKVTGANISVQLTDDFMKAVKNDAEFTLKYPVDSDKPTHTKVVKAKELWDMLIESAHGYAEPGLMFSDIHHWYSTSSVYPEYKNVTSNPCGEIMMGGSDSCRLVALNMFGCVVNPFTENAYFDFEKWYEIAYEGQRINDNLVDLELEAIEGILNKIKKDPEPDNIKAIEIQTWEALYKNGKNGRRTGLGFTALADAIAALGMKFDSDDAMVIIEKIMKEKCRAEFDSSIDMAIERSPFVGFDSEIEKTSTFIQMMEKELPDVYERMMKYGRRNISLSTVAPTGTVSLMAQTSSGIEPVFMLSYTRRRKINPSDKDARVDFVDSLGDKWQEYDVFHPKYKLWMDITKKKDVSESPYFGSTAPEIDWEKRIRMQGIVQKYTTHSISSTLNIPTDVSIEEVANIYMKSWEMGLKGVTVYRDGSRSGVLISKDAKQAQDVFGEHHAPKRPKELPCEIIRFQNNHEKWIAFIGLFDERPYEIFTGKAEDFVIPNSIENGWIIRNKEEEISRYDFKYIDKDGYSVTMEGLSRAFDEEYWNYARLISSVLRHGMPLQYVIETVSDLRLGDDSISTWKSGVCRAIKKFIKDGEKPKDSKCDSCGDEDGLIYQEGCLTCKSCGASKCS